MGEDKLEPGQPLDVTVAGTAGDAVEAGLAAAAGTAGGQAVRDPGAQAREDRELVEALRRGDEAAFMRLVDMYHAALLRVALMYVTTREVAEDVVQETWLGLLKGLDRFEGRSSLKTWLFHILVNTAKTRAMREGRSVPFSELSESQQEAGEPVVEPERFQPADGRYPGGWVSFPQSWDELPEQRLLSQETYAKIKEAIDALPATQRAVIVLRDVEGIPSDEVCNVLGVSESNQRVLLHRARARVRRALERYFDGSRWAS
jgi:RNA polymerase sigma-70 factor (ECF subfamily)